MIVHHIDVVTEFPRKLPWEWLAALRPSGHCVTCPSAIGCLPSTSEGVRHRHASGGRVDGDG